MKNFKKIVALVLALSLVLSMGSVSFAATTNEAQAKVLYDLGLFKGYSATEMVLGLEDETTAAQAITLIGRALGWAVNMDAVSDYSDVPAYAVPYVAYAVDAKITNGIGDGMFGSEVDGQRVVTWTLRALGYDMEKAWTETATLAATAGLTLPAVPVTRDSVAGAIYETLMATPVGGTMTVIETLVAANPSMKAVALAAGLIVDKLAVKSVTATNLKQFVVTYNKAVDADEAVDSANYSIDTDGSADLTGAKFDLSADAKVVTVTFDAGLEADQQEEITLTISDMMDADGATMEDVDVVVEFIDTTFPVALSAVVVGNDTIKVTFSEPIGTFDVGGDDFEVDGGDLVVQSVTAMNNNTELNVQIYSDLEAGNVDIKVLNSIEDFAGFNALSKTFTVPVVVDESAPVVIGFKDASPTGVTLIFNEDIEVGDTDSALYYHTNSNNEVDNTAGAMVLDTDYTLDGAELTLDFSTNELPAGTAYVYILAEAVNDLWDNDNDKIVVAVTVVADTTAPVIEDLEVDSESQITITFSEDVDSGSYDKYSFELLDEDGIVESNMIQSISKGADDVVITFKEDLNGDYSIVTEEVEDLAGNEILKTTTAFSVDDLTSPVATDFTVTIYNAGAADQMIKVDFDEAMAITGNRSVIDLSKYVLTNNATVLDLSDLDAAASIKAVDDNSAVEIMIPSVADDADDGIDIDDTNVDGTATQYDNVTLTIARVADAADNYTLLTSATLPTLVPSTVTYTAEATDVDTVVVTFDGKLSTFEKTEFTIVANAVVLPYSKLKTSINSDGDSVVTYTLTTDLSYDALSAGVNAVTVVATAVADSENQYGELVANGPVTVDDAITPALAETTDVNGDDVDDVEATADVTIVLTFTEDIDPNTVSFISFEIDGGDVAVSNVVVLNDTITLTVADQGAEADLYFLSVVQKAAIKDIAGNVLSDISTSVYESN